MKSFKALLYVLVVLGVLSVVFLLDIPTFMKIKRGQIKNYNSMESGSLEKGDPVSGTVDMAIGSCAEQYETKFGIRTSKDSSLQYFVLWMENDQLILYETGSKDEYNKLEKISDETADYLNSLSEADESGDADDIVLPTTTLEIEGVAKEVPDEIWGYFEEYYEDVFGDGKFSAYAEPLMISRRAFSQFTGIVIAGLVCAVLFVIVGIVTLVLWRKSKRAALY